MIPIPPALTVSNIGVTAATLTIANHSGNWYYQADTSPDNTCQGPVSGSSKALTGLSPHTSYSDSRLQRQRVHDGQPAGYGDGVHHPLRLRLQPDQREAHKH